MRTIFLVVSTAVLLTAAPALAVDPADRKEAEELRALCKGDALRLCAFVRPGEGRGLACLEEKADRLSVGCRDALPRAKALREKMSAERKG